MSESDAAPVGAAFVDVFFAGAELVAGAELEAALLEDALDGAIVDLLAGGVEGVELALEEGAMVESLMADLLFRLFLAVVEPLASELAVVLAELPPFVPAAG